MDPEEPKDEPRGAAESRTPLRILKKLKDDPEEPKDDP